MYTYIWNKLLIIPNLMFMMLHANQRKMLGSYGILIGRSLLGLLFVYTGYGMLMGGVAATSGYFASVGIPFAGVVYYIVVTVKLLAGSALILGYRVGCAAAALILFTLGATYFGHSDLSDQMNQIQITKNLAIVGGLLYVAAFGAGTGWRITS